MNRKLLIGLGVALLGGAAIAAWRLRPATAPLAPGAPIASPSAALLPEREASGEPGSPIAHPLAPVTPAAPLPTLEQSDAPMRAFVAELIGTSAFMRWIRPEAMIRHMVANIDNLGRSKLSVEQRLLRSVGGALKVDGDDGASTLSAENAARYAPLVQMVSALDSARLVGEYRRDYPLFQRAYRDLGYPDGYFNDRLVQVIDELLATPEVSAPIGLVRPGVMYQFADPQLEALSAGQKILLRIGAQNAAAVQAKLREVRALLVAAPAH